MRKRREREPTREEQIRAKTAELLSTPYPTPGQIYDLMLLGSQSYRQGMGLPHNAVWEAILEGFKDCQRYYMNPYKMALLRDQSEPDASDFATLYEQKLSPDHGDLD